MSEFERGCDLALRRVGRVLVELKFFDRDVEWQRLELVSQALHQNLRRKKFLVESDFEFLIGRPVLRWSKSQFLVRVP